MTDDTGRVAEISIDMDTKQVMSLDTTGSDFVPGFNADAPGAVGYTERRKHMPTMSRNGERFNAVLGDRGGKCFRASV